ncbi:hypothetical protein HW555_010486, partial [Spodoptera exigua]
RETSPAAGVGRGARAQVSLYCRLIHFSVQPRAQAATPRDTIIVQQPHNDYGRALKNPKLFIYNLPRLAEHPFHPILKPTNNLILTAASSQFYKLVCAIRDAVAGNRNEDDVVLPPFDPEKNDNGAENWCNNIDTVAKDRGWSSITTVSKAVTDRGTNFTSEPVRSFLRDMQINHHMIATGTPRSNGQAEKYVGTIINMLTTTVNDSSEWPSVLWKIQLSLNTTMQKSTGFSPTRLLIGCNGNIPPIQARLDEIQDNDYIQNNDSEADRDLARQNLRETAEKYKKRFDTTRRNNLVFKKGDIVYVNQNHRRHDKLSPKFKGPYEVIDILEHDRFSLKGLNTLRNIIVAKEKLKLWPGEWVEQNSSFEEFP